MEDPNFVAECCCDRESHWHFRGWVKRDAGTKCFWCPLHNDFPSRYWKVLNELVDLKLSSGVFDK